MAAKPDKFEFADFSVEPQVLEEIAAMAAGKVDGVSSLAGGLAGRRKKSAGVTASRADDHIEIEVHLVAEYGRPLKEVARKVQSAVSEAVESMVGRPVATVHVFVEGLIFPPTPE